MKQTYQERTGHSRVRTVNKNSKKLARQERALLRLRLTIDNLSGSGFGKGDYCYDYTKFQIAILEGKGVN